LKKILIVGDSFAADPNGWALMLDDCQVVNMATNGSSEYRIYKNLIKNVNYYDKIIVVHTSPNRIYVEHNPIHANSVTHPYCDLLYQDVAADGSSFANHVAWWFENVFDLEQANTMHHLLIDKIQQITYNIPTIHLTFFDYIHRDVLNLHRIWKKYPGKINHLSNLGNMKVAEIIQERLNNA
jgi:hypothetical protein